MRRYMEPAAYLPGARRLAEQVLKLAHVSALLAASWKACQMSWGYATQALLWLSTRAGSTSPIMGL